MVPTYLPSSSAVNITVKTDKCECSAVTISATAFATRCAILFATTRLRRNARRFEIDQSGFLCDEHGGTTTIEPVTRANESTEHASFVTVRERVSHHSTLTSGQLLQAAAPHHSALPTLRWLVVCVLVVSPPHRRYRSRNHDRDPSGCTARICVRWSYVLVTSTG